MPRRRFLLDGLALVGLSLPAGGVSAPQSSARRPRAASQEVEVATYYFPQYHRDPRNDIWHGPGWTEWEVVRRAQPRYPGHRQPIVPAWGYFDQSDPTWAAREIDLAANHGITSFIFDWYWYEDGPFLQAALEQGFLGAPNNDRLRFGLLWANHDWLDIFPAVSARPELLRPGQVSRAAFDRLADYVLEHFFSRPTYLTIEGEPFFSIYDIRAFAAGLGGLEAAQAALDQFRAQARHAGFDGLHVNMISHDPADAVLAEQLGVSSVASYTWAQHYGNATDAEFPRASYVTAAERSYSAWDAYRSLLRVPYYPAVAMGWDSSPRTSPTLTYEPRGYPWTAVLEGNTTDAFGAALGRAREFLLQAGGRNHVLLLNAWNEWTEGSYLLPDRDHGGSYLEVLGSVFPPTAAEPS